MTHPVQQTEDHRSREAPQNPSVDADLLEALKDALRRVRQTLLIPAAEYVPAIPDAWKIIDRALGDGQ